MRLYQALMEAAKNGHVQVYRVKYPGIHRGINTEFTADEHAENDWEVSKYDTRDKEDKE